MPEKDLSQSSSPMPSANDAGAHTPPASNGDVDKRDRQSDTAKQDAPTGIAAQGDQPGVTTPPRRAVRSFVLRQGRETVAQQRAMTELWPRYGIEFMHQAPDLDRAFGRSAPRMIEIGFGAGEALLEYAKAHPEQDCLGLEVHRPGVGHLLLGTEAAGLSNLRVISHDAVEVLQQLPAGSISTVHIFFPDPWPKKRHHKRRLIQPAFAELLARILKEHGVLRLATDWEHYAHHMREVLDACAHFQNVAAAQGFVERPAMRPLTRFERRGQRLGHGVWDLEYHRR